MTVNGKHYRTIWLDEKSGRSVKIINQLKLPHRFEVIDLETVLDCAEAIRGMAVRGAGLIGATAGFGMYLAVLHAPRARLREEVEAAAALLVSTRPTAKNLEAAVRRQLDALGGMAAKGEMTATALETAVRIAEEDAEACRAIGRHGLELIKDAAGRKAGDALNILTHCNAGWLAFVDHGSALSPIYAAKREGIPVRVWVSETRPRNQGAALTCWELGQEGVPHTLIADNAAGHIMQRGLVDLVITGADRVTRTGDAANKIGTYLKAVAARRHGIPFYIAFPSSTIDWSLSDGVRQIPIEERDGSEVTHAVGLFRGKAREVLIAPKGTKAANFGFDVTPAELITAFITERGVHEPARLAEAFPEQGRTGRG